MDGSGFEEHSAAGRRVALDRSGFVLRLPDTATSELTPQEVAQTLDKEGIKNRIVIVSACFSGIFVPPLANDSTIVPKPGSGATPPPSGLSPFSGTPTGSLSGKNRVVFSTPVPKVRCGYQSSRRSDSRASRKYVRLSCSVPSQP